MSFHHRCQVRGTLNPPSDLNLNRNSYIESLGSVHRWSDTLSTLHKDWMEWAWGQCFSRLGVSPTEHPVILSEPPLFSRAKAEQCAQFIFESFEAPAMFLESSPSCALYDATNDPHASYVFKLSPALINLYVAASCVIADKKAAG